MCQPIRPHELIECFHLDHDIFEHNTNSEVVQRLRHIPGPHGLAALFHTIKFAEDAVWSDKSTLITGESVDVADWQQVPVFNFNLDPTMTFPLPSTQAWLDATDNDQDLVQIRLSLQSGEQLTPARLTEKCYFRLWQNNQLETEGGLLYYYERSKTARFRQLRLKIVPVALRATIIAACHSSPFGGHSGIKRTYYRVAAILLARDGA